MNANTIGTYYVLGEITYNSIYKGQLRLRVNSVNVVNNSSNITVDWLYVKTASDPYGAYNTVSSVLSFSINGLNYRVNAPYDLRAAAINSNAVIASQTVNISHGIDGTKTISVGANHETNTSWGTKIVSNVAVSLPSIARSSDVVFTKASAFMNALDAITLNINRASSDFTHTLEYKLGSYSSVYENVATSHSFIPPLTWNNAVTSSDKATATLLITTYKSGVKVGNTVTKNFEVKVPSDIVPSIANFKLYNENSFVPSSWGIVVQGKSAIRLSIEGETGAYGSSIVAYNISGTNYSSASKTAIINSLTSAGNLTYTATVTDSRGRKSSKSLSVTVHSYLPPAILGETKVYRSSATGTADTNGNYVTVNPQILYSSVASKNSVTFKINNTTYPSDSITILPNYTQDSSHIITLSLTDQFTTSSASFSIPTAMVPIDIHSSGAGVALGKVCEQAQVIDLGLPAKFTGGISYIDISAEENLNNITTPGFYCCRANVIAISLVNSPTTIAFVLKVSKHAGVMQELTEYLTSGAKRYFRNFYNNAWGQWYDVYTEANKPSMSQLGAAGNNSTTVTSSENQFEINTDYGSTKIGARNANFSHFQTSLPKYYFDKSLYVEGEIFTGEAYDKKVYHEGNKPSAHDIGATENEDGILGFGNANTYLHVTTSLGNKGITWWESDKKIKENIKPTDLASALEVIARLEHKQYDNKNTKKHVDIGYVADDIALIYPQFTFKVGDTLNVDHRIMLPVVTKAIQELIGELSELQAEVESLKNKTSN